MTKAQWDIRRKLRILTDAKGIGNISSEYPDRDFINGKRLMPNMERKD